MKKAVLALVVALICGVVSPATAAVGFGSVGAVDGGTSSLSVAYPSSISGGDLLVLCICSKYPTNGPSTPSGWTLPTNGQASGGAGSAGIDSGTVYATVFVKEATGLESGNLSVTITGGNSAAAVMLRYTKGEGAWGYAAHGGGDNSAGTSWSVTAGGDPGIQGGDMVVVCSAVNGNVAVFSSEAIASSGVTYGAMNERADSGTTAGDDCHINATDFAVTSGISGAVPVFTMTSNSTSGDCPAGASVILRLRELSGGSNSAAAYYYRMMQQ